MKVTKKEVVEPVVKTPIKTPEPEVIEKPVETEVREEINILQKPTLIIQTNSYFRDYLEDKFQQQ